MKPTIVHPGGGNGRRGAVLVEAEVPLSSLRREWPAGPRRPRRARARPAAPAITREDVLVAVALALLAFAAYLATNPFRFRSIDELAVFAVARSLAARGSVDADGMLWSAIAAGEGSVVTPGGDGHLYALKDVGPSLLAAPLVWLGYRTGLGGLRPAMLLGPILTALTAGLVMLLGRSLGFRRRAALLAGVTFAFASLAWPYAGTLFTQPLAALALTLAALAATAAYRTGSLPAALATGLAMGLAGVSATPLWVTAAPVFAYMLPSAGTLRGWVRRALPPAAAFGVGTGVVMLGQAAYNWVRFGSPLDTGHVHTSGVALYPANLLPGLVGQLVSMPRGIIWFAPFALLVPVGAALGWARHRRFVLLTAATSLLVAGLYSMWFQWWGGLVWGPRFLVPLMPFWALLVAPLYERLERGSSLARWAVGLVLLASVAVQAVASLLDVFTAQIDVHSRLIQGEPWSALADRTYHPYRALLLQWRARAWDVPWARGAASDRVAAAALALLAGLAALWLLALWRGRSRSMGGPLLAQGLLTVAVTGWFLAHSPPPPTDFNPNSGALPRGLLAACRIVEAQTPREDALALLLPWSYLGWADAASGSRAEVDFFVEQPLRDESLAMLEGLRARHRRVWVVSQGVTAGSPENAVEGWLAVSAFAGPELLLPDGVRLRPYTFEPDLPPLVPVEQTFGSEPGARVTLHGMRWTYGANDVAGWMSIETHWSAPEQVGNNYTVTMQLFDAAHQRRVAQMDGHPVGDFLPTGNWTPGETVVDHRQLALPPGLPAGRYLLIVGVYDPNTGEGLVPVGGVGGGVGYPVIVPRLDGSSAAR